MIVSPARTEALLALIAVYRRDGRATVRSVALQAGRAPSTVYQQLLALRDLGLIEWQPEHSGTLRPAVYPIRTHVRNMGPESTNVARELDDPGAAPTAPGPADVHTLRTGRSST